MSSKIKYVDILNAYEKLLPPVGKPHATDLRHYKIEHGHTLDEYFAKYSNKLGTKKAIFFRSQEPWLLKKGATYWYIPNETNIAYFRVPSKWTTSHLAPVVAAASITTSLIGLGVGVYFAKTTTDLFCGIVIPEPKNSIAITAESEVVDLYLNYRVSGLKISYTENGEFTDYIPEDYNSNFLPRIRLLRNQSVFIKRDEQTAINDNLLSDTDQYRGYSKKQSLGEYSVSGNIASLIGNATKLPENAFNRLFSLSFKHNNELYDDEEKLYEYYKIKAIDASKLKLPYNYLSDGCYKEMFWKQTSLLRAPEQLPALNLANNCYESMFEGCYELTDTFKILPALDLTGYSFCYARMFFDCVGLPTAPSINATNFGNWSCASMYKGCRSLTRLPLDYLKAPLSGLSLGCYQYMFYGCSALTSPAKLPVEITTSYSSIPNNTFEGMYSCCSSIYIDLQNTSDGIPFFTCPSDYGLDTSSHKFYNIIFGTRGVSTNNIVSGKTYCFLEQ